MSRIRLDILAAVAALLIVSVALAACGGGSDKSGENPDTVLNEATLQGIESGVVDLSVGIDASGKEGGHVDVSLSGPFQGEGKENLPQLDMTAKAKGKMNGENVDFEGGLVLLPNSAYVNYEGVEYEVDPGTFSFVESFLNPIVVENGVEQQRPPTACEEEAGELEVADFVEGDRNEGSADVEGTTTTKISGTVNVPKAIDALIAVSETKACRSQLGAAGVLPSKDEIDKAKPEIERDLKSTHVDVYVGNDDIVRQVSAQLKIEPKGDGSGPESAAVDIDLKLSGVNEEQTISTPENAKPLNDLFKKLGVSPLKLLGLLEGGGGQEVIGELLEGLGASPPR